MNPTEAKVREVVTTITGLPQDVPADANLYLDLRVASVHALSLLVELETQFGVAIPDDDFVEATSIQALSSLMTKLSSGADTSSHA